MTTAPRIRIPNWERLQHYKTRRPTWIKLYRELLADEDYRALSNTARSVLPQLWLLACENGGSMSMALSTLERLAIDDPKLVPFSELFDAGFIEVWRGKQPLVKQGRDVLKVLEGSLQAHLQARSRLLEGSLEALLRAAEGVEGKPNDQQDNGASKNASILLASRASARSREEEEEVEKKVAPLTHSLLKDPASGQVAREARRMPPGLLDEARATLREVCLLGSPGDLGGIGIGLLLEQLNELLNRYENLPADEILGAVSMIRSVGNLEGEPCSLRIFTNPAAGPGFFQDCLHAYYKTV